MLHFGSGKNIFNYDYILPALLITRVLTWVLLKARLFFGFCNVLFMSGFEWLETTLCAAGQKIPFI